MKIKGNMSLTESRNAAAWERGARIIRILLVSGLAALGETLYAQSVATVVTIKGESIRARFLGATDTEITFETRSRTMTLAIREISYISFVGRPPSEEAVTYAKPTSPSSQLRAEGLRFEVAGNLSEALRKYEEAANLDPSDAATRKALDQVGRKIRAEEAAKTAAPYRRLAVKLRDAGRYAEAAACYDEAIRINPNDVKFKGELAPMRHYWEPTTCPVSKETPP